MKEGFQKILDQWKLIVGIVAGAFADALGVFSGAWAAIVALFE